MSIALLEPVWAAHHGLQQTIEAACDLGAGTGVCHDMANGCSPPQAMREAAWARLARDLDVEKLRAIYEVQPFDALPEGASKILANQVRGRVVIHLGD